MYQTRFWAAIAASMTLPCVAVAATLNVPGDFPTIQACIDAAISGVDECVVDPGTYHETINLLGKAITLRSSGGADVTTIDATGIGGSVVTCATAEGPDTVLDGFTITGGTGTDVKGQSHGGGMYNADSSPTVINCTFSENTATGTYGLGGGMYNGGRLGSSPVVKACTFSGNTASNDGGGMYNDRSSPTVTDCTFSGNTAYFLGGGGMSNLHSSPTVTECRFSDNTAYYGGGMANFESSPGVTNCTFRGNSTSGGGGMHNDSSSPTVSNCTFSGNTATRGGGMSNRGSSPTVTHCTFSGNTANRGGGMYNFHFSSPTLTNCAFSGNTATVYGGGMYNVDTTYPTVDNSTFSGNTATHGGGMYNDSSFPTITRCTFSGNNAHAKFGHGGGGGIYSYLSIPTVVNCILWGDTPPEIINNNYSVVTIRFSDVQAGLPAGAIDGGGNVDLNPMFVRPPDPGPDGTWNGVDDDYGDLRLQAGSPCINAGNPEFVPQPGETDLEGHARVLCERVDIGAYEFGIGDVDCNQTVNLTDFAAWPDCMTEPGTADTAVAHSDIHSTFDIRQSTFTCASFDFDGDGDIDLADFSEMQRVIEVP